MISWKRLGPWVPAGVFVAVFVLHLGFGVVTGIDKPFESDAYYFYELAVNLAAGDGYTIKSVEHTYWPDTPTMRRLPGWPILGSVILRLTPFADPSAAMRVACIALTALAAVLVCLLTRRLTRNDLAALFAGLLYAVHPAGLMFTNLGLSEPLFLVLTLGGTLAFLRGGWSFVLSGLLLGLACLVRANFVLWLGAAAVLFGGRWLLAGRPAISILRVLLFCVLFLTPASIWLARNHAVSGEFPVLSTLRGQTFYGGNNEIVANDHEWWGYWIFPDKIPGERRMGELAAEMTELEVDVYYYERGKTWIGENLSAMPKLYLGKLVRAYVPIPWKPTALTLVASAYRWVLLIGACIGAWLVWRKTDLSYRLVFIAMAGANVATVLAFWGYVRFAYVIEPFLMPFCAICGAMLFERVYERMNPSRAEGSAGVDV